MGRGWRLGSKMGLGRCSEKKRRAGPNVYDYREFYGLARFDHPSPAPLSVLHDHFPGLLSHTYDHPVLVPSTRGESIPSLHNRVAYTIARIIEDLDRDPRTPRSVLVCTHAAVMIALGRVLTGRMPEEEGEEDFRCGTCAFTRFERRRKHRQSQQEELKRWDGSKPEEIPEVDWRVGRGVAGGWDCTVNGDCSFLSGGEERTW
jgi:transcription factor C subunit 7